MLDFAIITVTVLAALLGWFIYLYPSTFGSTRKCMSGTRDIQLTLDFSNILQGSVEPSTIPGLKPTTKEGGNIPDIKRAGSLHEFLLDLHKQFGSIVSFWIGKEYVVSISSPELFKEHQGVFDRPPSMFKMFEPLLGPKSIQFTSESDGRARRHFYDTAFSHNHIKRYYQTYQDASDEVAKKWSSLMKEEHVPLSVHCFTYSLKVALLTMFGESFANDKDILEFCRCHDVVWAEMEQSLTENEPEKGSPRAKAFEEALKMSSSLILRVVKRRLDNPPIQGDELLIDLLIKYSDGDEELMNNDSITYTVGAFQTTANLLIWGFYFLASHPEVQEKAYREIKKELGNKDLDHTNIDDLPYVRQIVNETLRCAVIGIYAARVKDFESELGGHKIPKNIPVIHALGVSLKNEKYWPLPNKFDPDRFSPENVKTRPPLTFQPFGFAGKRICPGYRFAYAEATVFLVTLLRKFKVKLVDDQVVTPVHGLVTHPKEEVWITIEKR